MFRQLYYTSCEHGLSNHGGFQFNAVTPGVSPAVMREVENRMVYAAPRGSDEHPVAFSHGFAEAAGTAITAQVVSAGTDHSGRPGNYFAHAIVTGTPELDFGPLLPAELWGSPLWEVKPAAGTELPPVEEPPRGPVDRAGVQAFLAGRPAADLLPALLTAVGDAMAGGRPVLLASADVADSIWWIAAACYLLGDRIGRGITFCTYSHRPGYVGYHVTGVLPEALPPNARAAFHLFDLTTGLPPEGAIHPLATLLVTVGIANTAELWRQAAPLAAGTEQTFDDWLGPVTAAAWLLGHLHEQELSTTRLRALLGVAAPGSEQAGRLETSLAARAFTTLSTAGPDGELTGLLRESPGVTRALLARLAGQPSLADRLFGTPAGAHIARADLPDDPVLTELWLIHAAARGAMPALRAFDAIVDIRARCDRSPLFDGTMLRRLWPSGCPPGQVAELLGAITEPPPPDVLAWVAGVVGAIARQVGTGSGPADDGLVALARALDGHEVSALLPADDRRVISEKVLIAPLLTGTGPLGPALCELPEDIAAGFCRELDARFGRQPDPVLAARVFAALCDPHVRAQQVFADRLPASFSPVFSWHRRDLAAVVRLLEPDGLSQPFQDWRRARGRRLGRLRGP